MDFLAELNPAQQEAVTTMNGPVLALAGPGSGKTRALTHRIAYLIRAGGVAPWNIVAVTFTNKAAREMKHRLEQMLTANQVAHLHVGTFHSLCARWLRQDIVALGHYDRNFTIYDSDDQQAVVKRAIRDLDLDEKAWKPASLHHVISKAKNEMVTADKFSPRTYQEEVVARVYERYQKVLIENNALDFDDLLLVALQLLRQNQEIRQKYQQQFIHVMVDEFQDTNMVQYELTKILAGGHRNLFVVGDLDQGVYSWRGADYRNVLRFRQDYPDHKLIRLSQNYRSTDTILTAAKQLIRKNQNRIENDLFTERGVGAKIRVVEAYNEREEASWVVEEIRQLQAQGVSLGDMAVMYRTNAQSRLPEEAFIAHNLPYILVRGTSFYQRKEIKDALAYLRLLYNPEDSVSLERIINVPPRAIGAKTIADLYQYAFQSGATPWQALQQLVADEEISQVDPAKNNQPANLPTANLQPFKGKARKALVEFGQVIGMLIAAQKKLTLPELYDLTLARTGYKNHIKDSTPEGDERWENLVELRRVTEEFGGIEAQDALPLFLERVALVSDVDALKNDGQAVALLTLHTAKGLEFKAVFMIGMEEGLFPHSRSLAEPEQMEEERRLAYVGMTRAKDRLYLVRAFRRASYGFEELTIPSRFLADIPPNLVDDGDRRRRGGSTVSTPKIVQQNSSRWNAPSPTLAAQFTTNTPSYKAGDKVYHRKFGDGVIIGVEVEGGEEFVQVAFPGQGIKKLGVSFAPLERRS
jgi:DNA helicase-2/ATP-dependent DNA helicase PcrA